MAEMHTCRACGKQGPPAQIQEHVALHTGGKTRPMYGDGTVDVGTPKPSNVLKPGTRVSFEHQGQTHHGTIWSEAPNMSSGGNTNKRSGTLVPHRHVIPDGWRDTIPLPVKALTQIAGSMEASRNGEFHTAAMPQMPGQEQLGFMHNWHAEGRGPIGA